MADLPTGTVTFLFTDVEGSTRLWEEHTQAMRTAMSRHDALLQAAVEAHGGHLVKSTGDGFLAAFVTAEAALEAALDGQRALAGEAWDLPRPLRARMGVHSGPADQRNGDYFGPALNRAARLMGIAHGGQVLLSQAAYELARDGLTGALRDLAVRDLGEHRLRGVAAPERVFQLVHPDLPGTFPPLTSLDVLPNNLPVPLSSFVGREREVAEVKRLLATSRLLTLTGTGGCGKTRLALQVAADLLGSHAGGVWFVDLAPLSDDSLLPHTILTALGVREAPGHPPLATLIEHLRSHDVLVVLDNCEHLVVACAHAADALLRACPHVRLLATSRELLGVAGEVAWRVPSLSLPDPRYPPDPASLASCEAARLFVDRAVLVQPTFAITEENAAPLARVCRRLDGIPLAIELAAARVRALTVDQIAARLDDRFRLLTGGSRTALRRQQTLQALVDWSYDLLGAQERVLFRRLAVFAGGWTLEAAETICTLEEGDGFTSHDLLGLLAGLVDKSIVAADAVGAAERYHFLETIRQYAQAKLLAAPAEVMALRDRHAAHYLSVTSGVGVGRGATPTRAWLDALEDEIDNLRAALDWLVDHGRAEDALRLSANLWTFWYGRGHGAEGLSTIRRVLGMPGAEAGTHARSVALWCAAALARYAGEFGSARTYHEEGIAIARALGDHLEIALHVQYLGLVVREEGDDVAHRALAEEALAIHLALGHRLHEANTRDQLAQALASLGDGDGALRLHEEALAIRRQEGHAWGIGWSLAHLGAMAVERGDLAVARTHLVECLGIMDELRTPAVMATALEGFAALAASEGQDARAVRLCSAAAALRNASGAGIVRGDRERQARWLPAARDRLGEADAAAAWAVGQATTLDQAVREALTDPVGETLRPPR